MDQRDLDVIRNARRGGESFATLVSNYTQFVYRTAFGIVQNASDAEDVVQETFIKVHQSLKRLREERTFPSWLARITVRTALDLLQKRNKRETTVIDLDSVSSVERLEDRVQARLDLMHALGQMSLEQRTVLVLRELHGYDYDLLAEILDIPIGTVRSRLHHARAQLRQLLQDKGEVRHEV